MQAQCACENTAGTALILCDRSSSSIRSHRGTAEAKMSFSNVEHNLHITINASSSKSENYFSSRCRQVMWKRKVRVFNNSSVGVNINCYHFTTNILAEDEEDEVSIIEKRELSSLSPLWVKNVVIICRLDDVFKGSKTVILRCGMYIRP